MTRECSQFQAHHSSLRGLRVYLLLLLFGISTAEPAGAAQSGDIPSHPSELRFDPLDFSPPHASDHRHVLSNGVVVYIVEDSTLPLVDVSILIRAGSHLEPAGKEGLAGLTGNQIREGGTRHRKAIEFDEEVDFLAAQLSSSMGDTQGTAHMNTLSKDQETALGLFFEMLREPSFQTDRLELAKSRLLQAMQRRNDSTASIESREWERLMRGPDFFTNRAATRDSVESITREDLVEFHLRHYHPGRFIVAVSGDVKRAEILKLLEESFEGWSLNAEAVEEVPKPTHTPESGLYLVHKPEVNQGRVSIGHIGIERSNPDHFAVLVMNEILGGGGFSSRLLTRIRSDEGLAYSASSSYSPGVHYAGIFRTAFQSRNSTVARAAAIAFEEIERIRAKPVTEDELEIAITSFVETFPRRFSNAHATATLFAAEELNNQDPDYWQNYRENIRGITAEDVLSAAGTYLHPDRLVMLVVGEIDEIMKGDPDHPDFSLENLAPRGTIRRIPLPDPMTLRYPGQN